MRARAQFVADQVAYGATPDEAARMAGLPRTVTPLEYVAWMQQHGRELLAKAGLEIPASQWPPLARLLAP